MKRFLPGIFARVLVAATLIFASCAPMPAMAVGVGNLGFNVQASICGSVTNTNPLGSTKEDIACGSSLFPGAYLTGGTGAGQIDTFYAAAVTIAASGTATLDLSGSVTDGFGNSVALLHVKGIMLVAAAGNTNDCQIGPGASNPFAGPWTGTTPLTAVSPGETALWTKGNGSATGWAVVASTGDIIKLANSSSGTSVTCTVYVWGTST